MPIRAPTVTLNRGSDGTLRFTGPWRILDAVNDDLVQRHGLAAPIFTASPGTAQASPVPSNPSSSPKRSPASLPTIPEKYVHLRGALRTVSTVESEPGSDDEGSNGMTLSCTGTVGEFPKLVIPEVHHEVGTPPHLKGKVVLHGMLARPGTKDPRFGDKPPTLTDMRKAVERQGCDLLRCSYAAHYEGDEPFRGIEYEFSDRNRKQWLKGTGGSHWDHLVSDGMDDQPLEITSSYSQKADQSPKGLRWCPSKKFNGMLSPRASCADDKKAKKAPKGDNYYEGSEN